MEVPTKLGGRQSRARSGLLGIKTEGSCSMRAGRFGRNTVETAE